MSRQTELAPYMQDRRTLNATYNFAPTLVTRKLPVF